MKTARRVVADVRSPAAKKTSTQPFRKAELRTPGLRFSFLIMRIQDDTIVTEGKIMSVLAGTMFRVELENKHLVLAHISGKMRKRFIRLTTGDRVKIEMSPYDLGKARIVYRLG